MDAASVPGNQEAILDVVVFEAEYSVREALHANNSDD